MRVIGVMVESDESSFGVRELARLLDAPPSSVQRTLESGAEVSLVSPLVSGQWELGWELYRIAALAQRKRPFQAASQVLDELTNATGETSLLTVYDPRRASRIYVATSQSPRSVRFVPELFKWQPLHATASALAILAFRPEEERLRLLDEGLPLFAEGALDRATVERKFSEISRQGFAVSQDQSDAGASAVGAPIRIGGVVMSSIAVAVPNQRFDAATEQRLVEHVVRAAGILGQRMGDPLSAVHADPSGSAGS